jgi:hypothetical protein
MGEVISDVHGQVVALITENLTRRRLDETDPITADPFTDLDAARQWLVRTEVEERLIKDLLESDDAGSEAVGALVAFAATAVEMWGLRSGKDPLALVQNIASKWELTDE